VNHLTSKTVTINRSTEPLNDLRVVSLQIVDGSEMTMETGDVFPLSVNGQLYSGQPLSDFGSLNVSSDSSAITLNGLEMTAVNEGVAIISVELDDGFDSIIVTVTTPITVPDPEPIVIPPSGGSSGGGGYVPPPVAPVIVQIVEIVEEVLPSAPIVFSIAPYISGYPDGTFKPEGYITRAEVSKILVSELMLEEVKGTRFSDVSMEHWANGYIQAMAESGLIQGYGNGIFKPEANMSRAELATILARVIEDKGLVPLNDDTMPWFDMDNHWAKTYTARIYTRNIVIHEYESLFKPDQKLTRAEAVVMINQLVERGEADNESIMSFDDLKDSHWAYRHIINASSAVK